MLYTYICCGIFPYYGRAYYPYLPLNAVSDIVWNDSSLTLKSNWSSSPRESLNIRNWRRECPRPPTRHLSSNKRSGNCRELFITKINDTLYSFFLWRTLRYLGCNYYALTLGNRMFQTRLIATRPLKSDDLGSILWW